MQANSVPAGGDRSVRLPFFPACPGQPPLRFLGRRRCARCNLFYNRELQRSGCLPCNLAANRAPSNRKPLKTARPGDESGKKARWEAVYISLTPSATPSYGPLPEPSGMRAIDSITATCRVRETHHPLYCGVRFTHPTRNRRTACGDQTMPFLQFLADLE